MNEDDAIDFTGDCLAIRTARAVHKEASKAQFDAAIAYRERVNDLHRKIGDLVGNHPTELSSGWPGLPCRIKYDSSNGAYPWKVWAEDGTAYTIGPMSRTALRTLLTLMFLGGMDYETARATIHVV